MAVDGSGWQGVYKRCTVNVKRKDESTLLVTLRSGNESYTLGYSKDEHDATVLRTLLKKRFPHSMSDEEAEAEILKQLVL